MSWVHSAPLWSCDHWFAMWTGSSRCYPGMSSPLNPTGTSFGFQIPGQEGNWQISCSQCLSSSQLFAFMTFLDFPWKETLACCFPFSYIPFLVHPTPGCMNSQFPFLCAFAGSLDSKYCAQHLLQGTAGTRGCPNGHQHQSPVL